MLPPQLVPGILIGRCNAYCHTDIICGFRRAAVYNATVVISRNVRVVWFHSPAKLSHLTGCGTSTCVSSISIDSVLGHLANSFDLAGDLILHGHASLTGARFITVYLFINTVHLMKSLDRVLCSFVLWAATLTCPSISVVYYVY